jgi:hypothetical protein
MRNHHFEQRSMKRRREVTLCQRSAVGSRLFFRSPGANQRRDFAMIALSLLIGEGDCRLARITDFQALTRLGSSSSPSIRVTAVRALTVFRKSTQKDFIGKIDNFASGLYG